MQVGKGVAGIALRRPTIVGDERDRPRHPYTLLTLSTSHCRFGQTDLKATGRNMAGTQKWGPSHCLTMPGHSCTLGSLAVVLVCLLRTPGGSATLSGPVVRRYCRHAYYESNFPRGSWCHRHQLLPFGDSLLISIRRRAGVVGIGLLRGRSSK